MTVRSHWKNLHYRATYSEGFNGRRGYEPLTKRFDSQAQGKGEPNSPVQKPHPCFVSWDSPLCPTQKSAQRTHPQKVAKCPRDSLSCYLVALLPGLTPH